MRVIDGSGRPVERELTLPIADRRVRIGIRPLFEDAVEEGGNAGFEVMALDADGARIALPGLRWTLSKVQTSYQWYQTDGDWRFQPIVSRARVASGELDLSAVADSDRIGGRIEARVDWGGYQLEVAAVETDAGLSATGVVPASVGFEAGWYVAPKAFDTPDALKVSLDKAEYRIGETARVRLEPRFPGLALVHGGRRRHRRDAAGRGSGDRRHRGTAGHRGLGAGRLHHRGALSRHGPGRSAHAQARHWPAMGRRRPRAATAGP